MYTSMYTTHRKQSTWTKLGNFSNNYNAINKYIMIIVMIDSNFILVKPMTGREDKEMQRTYRKLMGRLKDAGVIPKKYVLDNKILASIKELIRKEYNIKIELVPSGCHRRNAAEVAIQKFKYHFLSILASIANNVPLYLWDRPLLQAEITLNLLRQTNATPEVSAYAHMCGLFDYNKILRTPMGSKVQVHETTENEKYEHTTMSTDSTYTPCLNTTVRTTATYNQHEASNSAIR